LTNCAIAVRLGLKEDTVCKALKRLGWSQPKTATEMELPLHQKVIETDESASETEPSLPDSSVAEDEQQIEEAKDDPTVEQNSCNRDETDESGSVAQPPLPDSSVAEDEQQIEEAKDDPTVEQNSCNRDETDESGSVAQPPLPDSCVAEDEQQIAEAKDDPTVEQNSCDRDPSNRVFDRIFARLGLLDDAAPLFESATNISHAGVLLAIPAIIESRIFSVARELYGRLGPSFYGLRTTFLTLLFMALLRIKCSESLKEYSPRDLGRVMGLDRACEVKTLRRKLKSLATHGKASLLGQKMAKMRMKRREETLGFLYVDGHVRAYHGKRKIGKAFVTQRRLAMPATVDYWINDQEGAPIFVVTSPANEGLVAMLPPILNEIKDLIGDERSMTIIFDRGGWSPKLFCKLVEEGFHIVTYRKGKTESIAEDHFVLMGEKIDGKKVEYLLHDCSIALLQGKCQLRQVTRLNPTGHQTHIVTSREDLSPVTIAYRMFERWRQENFFKYMAEEYALDALVDYGVEEDDPERLIPNPKLKEILQKRKQLKADKAKLERQYGLEALNNRETVAAANNLLRQQIEALTQREHDLKALCKATPARISLRDSLNSSDGAIRLLREKKHLTDITKMVAYQAETDLFSFIQPYYARVDDEGRTLIQSALKSSGSLEVTDDELRVILNPLSSPHRTRVIKELCVELNKMRPVFPGSKLRLVYDVKEQGHVSQN
jgi:hypothetical protein